MKKLYILCPGFLGKPQGYAEVLVSWLNSPPPLPQEEKKRTSLLRKASADPLSLLGGNNLTVLIAPCLLTGDIPASSGVYVQSRFHIHQFVWLCAVYLSHLPKTTGVSNLGVTLPHQRVSKVEFASAPSLLGKASKVHYHPSSPVPPSFHSLLDTM